MRSLRRVGIVWFCVAIGCLSLSGCVDIYKAAKEVADAKTIVDEGLHPTVVSAYEKEEQIISIADSLTKMYLVDVDSLFTGTRRSEIRAVTAAFMDIEQLFDEIERRIVVAHGGWSESSLLRGRTTEHVNKVVFEEGMGMKLDSAIDQALLMIRRYPDALRAC